MHFGLLFFYIAIILMLVLLTPIVIYNYQSFVHLGYLDVPLSRMFGLEVEAYNIGGNWIANSFSFSKFSQPLRGFFLLEFLLSIGGLFLLVKDSITNKKIAFPYAFIFLYLITVILLLLIVPITIQYIALIIPCFTFLIAYFFYRLFTIVRLKISLFVLIIYVIFTLGFAVNSQFLKNPYGVEGITYASVRPQSFDYAYLEEWLKEFYSVRNYRHSLTDINQLSKYHDYIAKKRFSETAKDTITRELVVYGTDLDFNSTQWIFVRRKVYDVRPIINSEAFINLVTDESQDFVDHINENFTDIYFIIGAPDLQPDGSKGWSSIPPDVNRFIKSILDSGYIPNLIIKSDLGDELFYIFRLSIAEWYNVLDYIKA